MEIRKERREKFGFKTIETLFAHRQEFCYQILRVWGKLELI